MRRVITLIAYWLCHDKKLLYLTAILVVLGGLVRIVHFGVSVWVFNIAFVPYFVMRALFYYKNRKRPWTPAERHRCIVLAVLFTVVALNCFTAYRVEFVMLILLMIDYLFVVGKNAD